MTKCFSRIKDISSFDSKLKESLFGTQGLLTTLNFRDTSNVGFTFWEAAVISTKSLIVVLTQ